MKKIIGLASDLLNQILPVLNISSKNLYKALSSIIDNALMGLYKRSIPV
jgi:hypothetical protein